MLQGRKEDLWNLPNILSTVRIATAPLLVLMLLSPGEVLSAMASVIFLVVCLTDWLDGYLARKMSVVTPLGKFLDPLADKLLIVTAFIMLIPLDRVPAWMVALIIMRELAVTGLRTVAVNMGVVIDASTFGKVKTVAQITCLVPLIMHYPFFGVDFHGIGTVFLWIAFVLTIWSGVDYFVKFFRGAGRTATPE
ncbi:MAG: CDP-diacylglycerol--glycerol-3-phosphate 3-phosphatidyltransferase [Thermodesulfobacteriota bacterium]